MSVSRVLSLSCALALSALALPGCAGGGADGGGAGRMPDPVRTSTSSGDPLASIEIPEPAAADERLQIGMDATRGLNDFVSSDRVVLGEHTTVDMTRTPFLAMSAFAVNPDDVDRRETRDDARGVLTITLTNRTGTKTVFTALPRVEIGGLLFVGVEQLVLRYHMRTDENRPIFLRAVAERKALYQDSAKERKERGGRVLLEMEVRGTEEAARCSENVRVDP